MNIKQLKSQLSVENIMHIMQSLNIDYRNSPNSNEIHYRTRCHGGDSFKLYFFKDSKSFHCYTHCGQMDIINLVQNVLNLELTKAIPYICNLVGISNMDFKEGFEETETINNDLEFLNSYKDTEIPVEKRNLKILNPNLLDRFYKFYHPIFLNDGINPRILNKFGIRYDILNRRIIIPHCDEYGNLIAIRARNLDEDLVEQGLKYIPIKLDGKLLSAKTHHYFYGLHHTKQNISATKKAILVEAEKSVMQLENILKDNISVALSGSSISMIQINLLRDLGVEEVIVAMDKDFHEFGTKEEKLNAMKIRKAIIDKLLPYFNVSVIWDKFGYLGYKDSPSDKGGEIFYSLYKNRILI